MSDVKTPPKQLVDLNPKWFGIHGKDTVGAGIIFDCPCQLERCEWGGKIAISFANPIKGEPEAVSNEKLWQRSGETFETLTLSPSIHCVGHWHGWLQNGVLVSC